MSETIESLEAQVRQLLEKFEELKKPKQPERWRAGEGQVFNCVERNFAVAGYTEYSTESDDALYNSYNYFKPGQAKELAMVLRWHTFLYSENVRLYGEYWRPEKGVRRYHIESVPNDTSITELSLSYLPKYETTFKTEEDAQEVIDNMPAELKQWAEGE